MAAPATTVQITFPQMGESVTEGTVLEWHKAVGDAVEADETLLEVSTDKVDTEIPSPASGTLTKILVDADETAAVGAVLGEIEAGEGPAAGAAPEPGEGPPAADTADDDGKAEAATTEPPSPAAAAPPSPPTPSAGNGDANATPVAARLAGASGVDLSTVPGTGSGGRITKQDVLAAADGDASSAPPPATGETPAAPAEATTTPLRGPAATAVRFMNESRSIPTATSFRTLPVATLDARRKTLKEAGQKLSFTHLIAWAIVKAVEELPVMTNSYAEADGKPQRVDPGGVSLGLAVDAERKDGTRSLVVPVIADAGALDFAAFAARYDELVAGARDNELAPDDYAGAGITLTNPGGIGTVASVPRLMPGQGTIIATGAIGAPAGLAQVPPERLAELGVEKVMTMTSTYDHRVIQGAESGAFLRRIDVLLQGEDGFYDEVFAALGVEAPAAEPEPERREATGAAAAATAAEPVPAEVSPAASAAPDEELLQAVQAATSVVKAHRMHGHLAAKLDPLGSKPAGDPALDPATVNLTPELMELIPSSVLRIAVPGDSFADALPYLQDTYCGTIAYEIEHISSHAERVWLRQAIESGEYRAPLERAERRRLLKRLSEVEALESYLHKAFLGKKQFSIEGLDALVPMLDETIELASEAGAREVVIGMAHRGRLNVLAHTVGRPYETILVEFEGEQSTAAGAAMPEGGTGDVKYHHGAAGTYKTLDGKSVTVTLSPNPSHLEYVNPVIEGRARADQTNRKGTHISHDPSVVLPVLIHGDAAFPGQGVVAETLNLQALEGYSTGGTIHVIANNQLGFTTHPEEGRSTRYASDLAKGFDMPIIHVNADDVEACVAAARLSAAFRERFGQDVLVDLIGYRRFGHNETDEPAYTQPTMYEQIKDHPPARRVYADRLAFEGVVSRAEVEALAKQAYDQLADAHAELKDSIARGPDTGEHELDRSPSSEPRTAVDAPQLRSLGTQLLRSPSEFSLHRKLGPQLEKRREAVDNEPAENPADDRLDWAQAEALAWASLVCQGVPIRLTGQDTVRGTFSQRHLTMFDSKTGEPFTPIQNLPGATAPFELHNSPLSEIACLGFEYGYSGQAPDALVLWEAQFGDFVNSAQVIVDQFLVSGLAKWGQTSRLTLMLPHGYEGSGPEHSSGRLERFLQLAAEGNIRVSNPSTPAQYFHLMRRQGLISKARPLIVMTPKSLLRHPQATSQLGELSDGEFHKVIDDPLFAAGGSGNRSKVTKLVLCSGKVYYDIAACEERESASHVAVARVELLYPFPSNELVELMASYPALERLEWAQEEPRNMGARAFMKIRLDDILPEGIAYSRVDRDWRASPGEGYAAHHKREQERIVRAALDL